MTTRDYLQDGREHPYFRTENEAMERALLVGPSAWMLYSYILFRARDKDHAWPSYTTIGRELGLSRKTISDSIQRLVEHGLIAVERQPKGQIYRVLPLQRTIPIDDATSSENEPVDSVTSSENEPIQIPTGSENEPMAAQPVQKMNRTSSENEPIPVQKMNLKKTQLTRHKNKTQRDDVSAPAVAPSPPVKRASVIALDVAETLKQAPWVGDDLDVVALKVDEAAAKATWFDLARDGPMLALQFVSCRAYRKKPPTLWYPAWLNWLKKERNDANETQRTDPVSDPASRRNGDPDALARSWSAPGVSLYDPAKSRRNELAGTTRHPAAHHRDATG